MASKSPSFMEVESAKGRSAGTILSGLGAIFRQATEADEEIDRGLAMEKTRTRTLQDDRKEDRTDEEKAESELRVREEPDGQARSLDRSGGAKGREPSLMEVLQCDFTMGVLEALRFLSELWSPQSRARLCWELLREESPKDERVSLLEFMETELTFVEFSRLILRLVERHTEEAMSALPLHRRLEGFMRHVFLPALKVPYVPPIPPPAPMQEPADPPVQEEATATDAPGPETDAPPSSSGGAREAGEPKTFWRGLLNSDSKEAVTSAAPRCWPKDYDQEAAEW
jgi:hypothetical protein